MKTPKKRPVGRPTAERPKNKQVAFRVDDAAYAALKKMRDKIGVLSFSPADAARELVLRALKQEGLM